MDRQIAKIFQDLFSVSPARCTDTLSPEQVEGWDSVNHMTLVLTLEQTFGVQFAPEEISELSNVGAIKRMLLKYHAK
jgi:acyl carrier protein